MELFLGWIEKSKLDASNNLQNVDTQNQVVENTIVNTVNETTNNVVVNNNTTNEVVKTNTTNIVTATNTVNEVVANTTNAANTVETNVGKQGVVKVETARVRKEASTKAEVIDTLDEGDKITIEAEEGEFYKFSGGYVSKSLITIEDASVSSRSLNEERNENVNFVSETDKGSEVVAFAKKYLGYKYVSGGKTPEDGFDCSGFTSYVFSNFGYSIGSTTSAQANVGTEITRSDIKPGDLLVFLNEGKTSIGHVGIYIGNNEFIHSANPTRGVVTDNLQTSSYYNERYVTARRIAN